MGSSPPRPTQAGHAWFLPASPALARGLRRLCLLLGLTLPALGQESLQPLPPASGSRPSRLVAAIFGRHEGFGVVFRKGDPALLPRLNHGLDANLGSPQYQATNGNWWGRIRPYGIPQRALAWAAGITSLLMAGMACWRFRSIRGLLGGLAQEVEERKRSKAKAREGAEHFRLLFETMADAVFLIDADGKFIEANRVAADRLGYSREELLRLGPRDINPLASAQGVEATFARLEREGSAVFTTRHVRKDGSSLPVEIYSRRIDLGGRKVILSTARDISDRLQAEEALAQEADFARNVFNANEDAMAVVDEGGLILDVNEAWRRFGLANGAGSDLTWSIGANYFRPVAAGADQCLAGKAYEGIRRVQAGELPTFELEYACDAPDEPRWFSMHVLPVTRKPGVVLISHRDQTAQKSALVRIQQSEERYRRVAENLAEGLVVTSPGGTYSYCNRRFTELFGYSHEEILRMGPLDLVPEEHRAAVSRKLEERSQGRADRYEQRLRRKDGTLLDCLVAVSPLLDEAGAFQGSLALITDITDKQRLEKALAKAEKAEALGEMAAGLAHDFNNLFQSILSHLELAKARLEPGAPASQNVGMATENLLRAAMLSQQILQFTGASLRHAQRLHFSSWLQAQKAALVETLHTTGPFELKLEAVAPEGWVTGDPDQLLSVVRALLVNAGEAMGEVPSGGQGAVRVSMKALSSALELPEHLYWAEPPRQFPGLCLTVEDPGRGLPPGQEQRIFDPFHSTKAPGRGLGLSAALGILRAHGGGIGIGAGPDGTTLAALYLPLSSTEPGLPEPGSGPGGGAMGLGPAPESILLADDDPSLVAAMAECLELLGHPVLTARDGLEALDVFRTHRSEIALVILDAQMPRMGGIETFQQLRALAPELQVLLCTGFGEAFGRATAGEYGFNGFLGKPFRLDELKAALASALRARPSSAQDPAMREAR